MSVWLQHVLDQTPDLPSAVEEHAQGHGPANSFPGTVGIVSQGSCSPRAHRSLWRQLLLFTLPSPPVEATAETHWLGRPPDQALMSLKWGGM